MRGKPTAKPPTSAVATGQDMSGFQDFTNGNVECPSSGLQSSAATPQSNGRSSSEMEGWGPDVVEDQWGTSNGGDVFDSTNQVTGSGYASETCRHCGGDHRSSECPSASTSGRGGGGGGQKCYNCQEFGHMSRECPAPRGDGGERRPDNRECHKCGQTGHISRMCTADRSSGGDRSFGGARSNGGERSYGGDRSVLRCSNCEGKNHTADQCPSPKEGGASGYGNVSSQRPGAAPQTEAVCHRCNDTGHFAHNCPQRVGYEAAEAGNGPYVHTITTSEQEAVNRNNVGINFKRYKDILVKVTDSQGHETSRFEAKKLESFADANLDAALMAMINKMGYQIPTPVQKFAIPMLSGGYDIMACAQTGSGKTAAFVLPIVNDLIQKNLEARPARPQKPYALILTPTRELTVQITTDAQQFCCRTSPSIRVKECYGGTDMGAQIRNITSGAHIIVGTTGRVQDFLNKDIFSLAELRFLVLDEADRMLDMGFSRAVREILEHPSRNQKSPIQTVMFSATFPRGVQDLARSYLRPDFVKLDVGIVGTVNSDVQQFIEELSGLPAKKKRLVQLVSEELESNARAKILVFVETKRIADTVASFLSEMGKKATSMHGDRLQEQREKALRDFQENDCPVLVATSVAARGLDISGVTHVVNFDLPKEIDDYIHRVGRTGRVGNIGRATSFYDSSKDSGIGDSLRQSFLDGGQNPPAFL